MRYRLLGPTGLRVSEICLGTMSFGEKWGFGATPAESRKVIDAYAEAGGNFLDTANKYHEGQTEEIVGEAIAQDRDRWVVATKYTLAVRPGDANGAGNARKNMMRSVEESLERMQLDVIDLLWLHAWDFTTPVEEVMRGLDDLVRQGKVHYVGISDAPAWIVSQANTMASLRGWSAFCAIQVQYSLIERTVERDLLPMAESFGLGVAAWAPIGAGLLTGKYTRNAGGEVDTKRNATRDKRLTERNLHVARELDAVADAAGCTSAQAALAWIRQRGGYGMIPLVGARRADQLVELLACTKVTLSDAQMARLDEASRIDLGFPHDFLGQAELRPIVYGDLAERLELPERARPRR